MPSERPSTTWSADPLNTSTTTLPGQVEAPEFTLDADDLARVRVARLKAVAVRAGADGGILGDGARSLLAAYDVDVAIAESMGLTGRAGEIADIPTAAGTILLTGIGAATTADLRRAGAALARRCRGHDALATDLPAITGADLGDEALIAFVEGLMLASFRYTLATGDVSQPVASVVLTGLGEDAAAALDRALALGRAGWRSRLLATVPSNIKSPAWLADQAAALGGTERIDVRVWDEVDLARDGFGGILAVGGGSANPPRFVQIGYRPAKGARKAPHVVLVGKGITFDSGGLNIKTGESMRTMKRDMTGAGVVTAVMGALAELDCRVRVTGLLCIAENSIGAGSMRPGDVLTHVGGRTTEVVNTDAEGRLVLADGLAHAVTRLKPDVLVDIATLTGAVKVALGLQTGGLYATSDELAAQVLLAGEQAGERLWRMPLVEEYVELLDSTVADAINAPVEAGSISAALFLRPFTGGLPWVHLDVASVGDSTDRDEWTAGPTGFGARLLLRWLTGPDAPERIRG